MTRSTSRAGAMARPVAITEKRMAEVTEILCPICRKNNPLRERTRFCQHCGSDVVLNNEAPTDHLRYYITRIIKSGGQGAVYEGIDQNRKVYAIKEMLDRFGEDDRERNEAIQRFNEEALLLQGLAHPRIPRVYSHFTDGGRHYLTMDFVQGDDLEQIIERDGPQPEARVLPWADQICDVLSYLHGKGLIYRDMKPSNVMIERSTGSVKLVDFGIAKNFKPAERGTQIGTPGYAPPEQYQGFATPASDIYALAATLHHLLTGRDPTEQAPFSFPVARDVNVYISRRTSDALQKALQMKPEDRFATIAEFRAMLRPLAAEPAQVRINPAATVALPAAARPQAGTHTAAAPAPKAPAAPRSPTTPPPGPARVPVQHPAPVAKPAPVPASPPVAPTPARRGGALAAFGRFVRRLVATVLLLLLLAFAAVTALYVWQPDFARPYLPPLPAPIQQLLPQPAPTAAPQLTLKPYRVELVILVPAGADPAAVRQAFIDAYQATARSQFGDAAVVNRNIPLSYVGGDPVQEGTEGDKIRWRATLDGFVLAP